MLTTEIIRGRKAAFALEEEYVELYESLPCPNVYLSPEWVYAWLISLGRSYEVCFITCWEDGALVGVWPFFETSFPVIGKALLPLGVHTADTFDPIALPQAMDSLLAAIDALTSEYAFIWLPLVTRDFAQSVLAPGLKKIKARHLLRSRTLRFLVELERYKDFDSYSGMVFGPKTRQNLRRKARRLGEEGEVQYLKLETPEEITPWIEQAMNLERQSWKGAQGVGAFKRGDFRSFYHLAIQNLAAKGRLRLSLLTIEGHLAAYEIGLLGKDYYCMHNMAFDPSFSSHSPGRILMLLSLETCFAEKRRIYDFMQNDQEFKRQMSSHESSLWDCIIIPRSIKGLFLLGVVRIIDLWTKWKKRRVSKEGALERDEFPQATDLQDTAGNTEPSR